MAVSVKVAVPVNGGGGVQVAVPGVLPPLFANVPPAPPSDHTAEVVPSRNEPPKAADMPPWQISAIAGPTSTHCDATLPANNEKVIVKIKISLFMIIFFGDIKLRQSHSSVCQIENKNLFTQIKDREKNFLVIKTYLIQIISTVCKK